MAFYLDQKYVQLLSPKLKNFKRKSSELWNCSCPLCGDSKKSQIKARGYFYKRKDSVLFTCHNCGITVPFGKFLKGFDPALYGDYQIESFGKREEKQIIFEKPKFTLQKTAGIKLPSLASLPDNHTAKKLILARKVPKERLSEIFYADNFAEFISEIFPHLEKNLAAEPRIVFPFYDEKKNILGVQGRALQTSAVKYITIKVTDEARKIAGLDRVDLDRKIYVVEGIIDSFFLPNSLAMLDATLYTATFALGRRNFTFISDNEPRNKEITRIIEKTIEMNLNVCIWPTWLERGKDINEMVLNGLSSEEIKTIIDQHTFSGLRAKLEFNNWKKV